MKKVNNEELIAAYKQTGSVWKAAEIVGMCGQSVYERLSKLGIINRMNLWTLDDDKVLLENYKKYKDENNLDLLAAQLGRTKQFICRKARTLGLTDRKDHHMAQKARDKLSISTKRYISEKGHPKGFLGHKHSAETLNKLSEASKRAWGNPDSVLNSDAERQRRSDLLHERKMNNDIYVRSIWGDHKCKIGEKEYTFKSSWEVSIAKSLQELSDKGLIKSWGYEIKHFDFPDMRLKTRSYCPDFGVLLHNGKYLYIEVKGWKMKRSMNRISMFLERYPHEKFYLIDNDEYKNITNNNSYLRNKIEEYDTI